MLRASIMELFHGIKEKSNEEENNQTAIHGRDKSRIKKIIRRAKYELHPNF